MYGYRRLSTILNTHRRSNFCCLQKKIKKKFQKIQHNQFKVYPGKYSITEALIEKDVIMFLFRNYTTETGVWALKDKSLVKLMPSGAELHGAVTFKGVSKIPHISRLKSDKLWFSSRKHNLTITNLRGDIIDQLNYICSGVGFHTVNNKGELIFIDSENNIKKYSIDRKTPTRFIKTTDNTWIPLCVYWSSNSRELLVGMRGKLKSLFKITWYSPTGQLIQTVQYNNTESKLCTYPRFITENSNRDIVVSGPYAVVIADHGGRRRFSYTSQPSGSKCCPQGICTDALSNILVSEKDTVQLIDVNGKFFSFLLIRPPGIFYPYSLSYDSKFHRLWVAARNVICVYRYIKRQDFLAGKVYQSKNRLHDKNEDRYIHH